MAITIGGIRVKNVDISFDADGKVKATGNYHLESNTGVVLAKQGFNNYGGMEFKPSAETQVLINSLIAGVQKDINQSLGLE